MKTLNQVIKEFTIKALKSGKKPDWEYCECGCHGFTTNIAGILFWEYNSLLKGAGQFYLGIGHGFLGSPVGKFATSKEVDRAVCAFVLKRLED